MHPMHGQTNAHPNLPINIHQYLEKHDRYANQCNRVQSCEK